MDSNIGTYRIMERLAPYRIMERLAPPVRQQFDTTKRGVNVYHFLTLPTGCILLYLFEVAASGHDGLPVVVLEGRRVDRLGRHHGLPGRRVLGRLHVATSRILGQYKPIFICLVVDGNYFKKM